MLQLLLLDYIAVLHR